MWSPGPSRRTFWIWCTSEPAMVTLSSSNQSGGTKKRCMSLSAPTELQIRRMSGGLKIRREQGAFTSY
jgi:hypothetical protein